MGAHAREVMVPGEKPDEHVKVLFIAGHPRSGSTLLEILLAQESGFVAAGEVRYIWDRSFADNLLCSCGERFRLCPFWREVVRVAFGSQDHPSIRTAAELARRIDHTFASPQLLSLIRTPTFQSCLNDYAQQLAELYTAILKVSGCRVVIDSSKMPTHGFIVHEAPGIDLHLVHLVRDSRAVAFSWTRRKLTLEDPPKQRLMEVYAPASTAVRWSVANLLTTILTRRTNSACLVRYEDFVREPRRWLTTVVRSVDGRVPALDFLDADRAFVGEHHTVAGNPLRFQRDRTITIRCDREWRSSLPRRHKILVTALTWPLLLRYDYFSDSRGFGPDP